MMLWKRIGQGALLAALLVLTSCTKTEKEVSILFGGDVFLARGGQAIFTGNSPWSDLKDLPFDNETLFAVNLESPLGMIPQDAGELNLCADIDQVQLLTDSGVDLVNRVNNHAGDCLPGEDGSEALSTAGIAQVSSGGIVYYEIKTGFVAAFIAASESDGALNLPALTERIRIAKENSDLVVVSMHWGEEYQFVPAAYQQELAHELVNAGADVVWGHHPHVLQRMEWYPSSTGNHAGLILYSMGNLLSDQWMFQGTQMSALVEVVFTGDDVKGVRVIPLVMDSETRSLIIPIDQDQVDAIIFGLKVDELEKAGLNVEVYLGSIPAD